MKNFLGEEVTPLNCVLCGKVVFYYANFDQTAADIFAYHIRNELLNK